jgi:hypothetical protein
MASQRADVGRLLIGESGIPFCMTIVPYWSIDLFYGVRLSCATQRALHACYVAAAQVISVACFLAFAGVPFPRPQWRTGSH